MLSACAVFDKADPGPHVLWTTLDSETIRKMEHGQQIELTAMMLMS
jgi:hypothetical protein